MSIDERNRCETHLLDDLPATSDAFASSGNLGPHQRVADAIGEMIESAEVGGKAIGLEGGWGSGKSTVVRFLADRFSDNDDFTLVLFDAWAHEGDPLRRTFIEAIVHELCEYGWANKRAWKKKLEELANRRKKTTTRITPKPTALGKAMAISLLLVPAGTALISGGFRSGVAFGLGLPPNWFFCFGLYLVLAPFWVLLYRMVQLRTNVSTVLPGLVPIGIACLAEGFAHGNSLQGTIPRCFLIAGLLLIIVPAVQWLRLWHRESGMRKGDAQGDTCDGKGQDGDDDWAFLISRAINETETETIETPNPTSLEFDGYFADLMREALTSKSRRLLLVLDNLDRVDSETALSIWGTLQTFLHDRDHNTEHWFKQLWVIVPYDPIRIRKLWNHPEERLLARDDEQSYEDQQKRNGATETRRTTESFLDKSFQVRFHVAPPVLSDWKSYLYSQVIKALPGHSDDCHMIYRVFDHCRARGGDPPTPRELKLFVNQIGAIHRQWEHEFPLSHVAFYVLARKKHPRIIDALRKADFLDNDDRRLLGDEVINSLAGLAFNVRATKGLELLLADSIIEAINSLDPSDLKGIADRNGGGFWAVLEAVATTRWHEESALGLTRVASQLLESGLLDTQERPEKQTVLDSLRYAGLNMKTWHPQTKELGSGLCSLLSIQSEEDFSTTVINRYCDSLIRGEAGKKEEVDAAVVAQITFNLFDQARSLGHDESIPDVITLPFQGEEWISACTGIEAADSEANYWSRLRPAGKVDEVTESFMAKISSGEFSADTATAVKITGQSAIECDWDTICDAIKDRLDASQGASSDECSYLLHSLFQLEALGVEASKSTQAHLCQAGHLLHYFHQAQSQKKLRCQALIILSFARQFPNLDKPSTAGNSEGGHNRFVKAMSEADEKLVANIYSVAKIFGLLPEVLRITQEAEELYATLTSVLKMAADSETPEVAFSSDSIKEHWKGIRDALNDDAEGFRFQKLVGTLARSHGLCQSFQEVGFDSRSSPVYLEMVRGAKDEIPEFVEWLREGLQRLSKDEWLADLRGNNETCALCIELCEQTQSPELKAKFADALKEHAKAVVSGNDIPVDWIVKKWTIVLGCIEEGSGTRKVLREHIVDIATTSQGTISDRFFDMYGDELDDHAILAAHPHVLSRFFSPLISENNERGLQWLDVFAERNPGFISTVEAEHTAQDFSSRLQELVDGPEKAEHQSVIDSIAAHFGIVPTPKLDKPEDADEVQLTEKDETQD